MRHIQAQTELGKLTEIVLHWQQVNMGISYSLLHHTKTKVQYTGATWFMSIRDFLKSLNRTLNIPSIQNTLPQKLPTNDTFLMNDLDTKIMTTTDRKRFNNVGLWIKVYGLFKICTVDEQKIACDSWTKQHIQYTNQLWPMQAKPGSKSFG